MGTNYQIISIILTFNEDGQLFQDVFNTLGYKYIGKNYSNIRYFKKRGVELDFKAIEFISKKQFKINFKGKYYKNECRKIIDAVEENLVEVYYEEPFWDNIKEDVEYKYWYEEFNIDKYPRKMEIKEFKEYQERYLYHQEQLKEEDGVKTKDKMNRTLQREYKDILKNKNLSESEKEAYIIEDIEYRNAKKMSNMLNYLTDLD